MVLVVLVFTVVHGLSCLGGTCLLGGHEGSLLEGTNNTKVLVVLESSRKGQVNVAGAKVVLIMPTVVVVGPLGVIAPHMAHLTC